MQTVAEDQLANVKPGGYLLGRELGRGKVSAVYEAHKGDANLLPGQESRAMVTLFLIPDSFSENAHARFVHRLRETGKVLTTLHHPHILPIYSCDEQASIPFMITPFARGNSLARVLKQQGRLPVERSLTILQQVTEALDYAHQRGVVHGTLSATNILLQEDQKLQVAGFGLMSMLEMHGIVAQGGRASHLLSIAGTLLGNSSSMAPELVQGAAPDVRTDVYALGVVLYEMLTGTLPFKRSTVSEALTSRPIASVTTISRDIPAGLDLVLSQALEFDPARRFQSAGEVVRAFERVLSVVGGTSMLTATPRVVDVQATMPPSVNWAQAPATAKKPPQPMMNTGSVPAAPNGNWQLKPPIMTSKTAAIRPGQFSPTQQQAVERSEADDAIIDPFTWWTTSTLAAVEKPTATNAPRRATTRAARAQSTRAGKKNTATAPRQQRRQVVALLVGGLILGGAGIVGASRLNQYLHPAATTATTTKPAGATTSITQPTQAGSKGNQQKPPTAQPTKGPQKATTGTQPTATQAQPTATQAPKPQPTTAPTHTGTVVGSTMQGVNSSATFTNPGDNAGSLLIHLPGGTFAAYEKSCPHEGVTVYYDTASHLLVCPRHNAHFDPNNGAKVLDGPPPRPLTSVSIHVNGDGTITVG